MTNIQLKKIQEAKAAQALKAQAQASKVNGDNDGITVNTTHLTNADIAEAGMLLVLNAKRVAKGLAPYKDYSEYVGKPKNYVVNTETSQKIDPVTAFSKLESEALNFGGQPLKAKGEVYHIILGGYTIGYNKSRCYIQKDGVNQAYILVHGNTLYGESAVMNMIPNKSFRDLTREEVDSIVSSKPAYKDLFRVYSKLTNFQNVVIDVQNALPVW